MKQIFTIVILLFGMLVLNNEVSAQNCKDELIYRTSSIGDGKKSIPYPLMFIIKNDSLRIANNEQAAMASNNVPFKILEKKCEWDSDYKSGKSVYNLSINTDGKIAHPTLTIEIKDNNGAIVLQYENSEPRVFKIITQ